MTIKKINTTVIQLYKDDTFWTVVQSYRNFDGIDPVYTIIQEDAHASPLVVYSNKKAQSVNEYFNHDIIKLFDENQ